MAPIYGDLATDGKNKGSGLCWNGQGSAEL